MAIKIGPAPPRHHARANYLRRPYLPPPLLSYSRSGRAPPWLRCRRGLCINGRMRTDPRGVHRSDYLAEQGGRDHTARLVAKSATIDFFQR